MVVDALSRVDHLMSTTMLTEVGPLWVQELLNNYVTDLVAQDLLTKLALHSLDEKGFLPMSRYYQVS